MGHSTYPPVELPTTDIYDFLFNNKARDFPDTQGG